MKLFGGRPPRIVSTVKSFFEDMPTKWKIFISACLIGTAVIMTVLALLMSNVKPPQKPTDVSGETEIENDVIDGDQIDIEDKTHKKDFFTILVVGRDKVGLNTDTIMLGAFDIATKKINVLSIPRDTIVNVKRSNKKINAAFSVGGGPNIEELMYEVESVTGIRPDRYAIVTIDGFVEMIDAIGGVTVDVPVNMNYSDPAQDLKINIKKGIQHLDGYDAMGFMRFRSTYVEGDIGRVKVQQTFIKALVDKMLKPSTLTKIPKLADIVFENVKTDLTVGNIIWLGKEALDLNPQEDINTFILPGEGGYYKKLSYYFPYQQQVLELINEHFNPYVTPIKRINIIDPRGEEETKTEPVKKNQAVEEPEKKPVTDIPSSEEVEPEPEVSTPEEEPEQLPQEPEQEEVEEPNPETPDIPDEEPSQQEPPSEPVVPEDFYQNQE